VAGGGGGQRGCGRGHGRLGWCQVADTCMVSGYMFVWKRFLDVCRSVHGNLDQAQHPDQARASAQERSPRQPRRRRRRRGQQAALHGKARPPSIVMKATAGARDQPATTDRAAHTLSAESKVRHTSHTLAAHPSTATAPTVVYERRRAPSLQGTPSPWSRSQAAPWLDTRLERVPVHGCCGGDRLQNEDMV
jgi:hypothetical protein